MLVPSCVSHLEDRLRCVKEAREICTDAQSVPRTDKSEQLNGKHCQHDNDDDEDDEDVYDLTHRYKNCFENICDGLVFRERSQKFEEPQYARHLAARSRTNSDPEKIALTLNLLLTKRNQLLPHADAICRAITLLACHTHPSRTRLAFLTIQPRASCSQAAFDTARRRNCLAMRQRCKDKAPGLRAQGKEFEPYMLDNMILRHQT